MYVSVAEILSTCERSLQRLSETADCQYGPSGVFCKMMGEFVQNLSASMSAQSVDEMKRMKTIVKDKLVSYDMEVKTRLKEVMTVKQSMDKHDSSLERIQSDIRKVHASLSEVRPGGSRVSLTWNRGPEDKDKLFEKIQKLKLDQQRVANDSEYELGQLGGKHLQSFNRLTVTVNELSSMRRRLNRKVLSEIQAIVPRIQTGLENLLPMSFESFEKILPSSGDFGMRLPPAELSLSNITGCDREAKILLLRNICDVIEYRAVQTYIAKEAGELSFSRNEKIEVINKESSGWWFGANEQGLQGYFPSVLIGERPANVPLPSDSGHKDSYRPKLSHAAGAGTWKSAPSMDIQDERIALIRSHPEGTFVGIVHFAMFNEEICLETNDIVDIIKLGPEGKVIVRNERNQVGPIPLNIITVKFKANENVHSQC